MVTFDIPCYFHMFDHLNLEVLQAMISYFTVDVESCSDGALELITKSRIELSIVSQCQIVWFQLRFFSLLAFPYKS